MQKTDPFQNFKQELTVYSRYPVENERAEESREYEAVAFDLAGKSCKFRSGKKTPRKEGFFVVVWKRVNGKTLPHDSEDEDTDCLIIAVEDEKGAGYFAFSRNLLTKKGILSVAGKGGKRGFRIYPPWSDVSSSQAISSKLWQCECFYKSVSDLVRGSDCF